MTTFGGPGGFATVPFEEWDDDLFAQALNRACGERMRQSEEDSKAIWSALANVDWIQHGAGHDASYSFRAAGDLIAAIRGCGDYMDWYCSGDYATVAEWVREAMAREGWEPQEDESGS